MTVAIVDIASTAEFSSVTTGMPITLTIGAEGNDRLIVVAVVTEDTDWSDGTSDIRDQFDFDTGTCTKSPIEHTGAGNASVGYCYMLDADMPAAGGTYDLEYTGSFVGGTSAIAYYLTGVSQTVPFKDDDKTNITTQGDHTISNLTAVTGDMSIITAVSESTATTFSYGAAFSSQTVVIATRAGSSTLEYSGAYEADATSIGVTHADTVGNSVASAIVIRQVPLYRQINDIVFKALPQGTITYETAPTGGGGEAAPIINHLFKLMNQ